MRRGGDLNFATSCLTPGYGRAAAKLRAIDVDDASLAPLPQGHAPDGSGPVYGRLVVLHLLVRLGLNVYLARVVLLVLMVVGRQVLILLLTFCHLLELTAHTLLSLGHGRYRRELLQQGVATKRPLNRQRGVSRLDATVLSLQHLYLLVQEVLRQLVPVNRFLFHSLNRHRSYNLFFTSLLVILISSINATF